MESQDRDLDGHVDTLEVEVGEYIVISTTSTFLVESFVEVYSSNTLDVDVRMDDSTHYASHEMSDVDSNLFHSANFESKSLFESGHHHLIGQLEVDVKVDPLLSGATTSVLITHDEGDTLQ